jgi:hypothetical protein
MSNVLRFPLQPTSADNLAEDKRRLLQLLENTKKAVEKGELHFALILGQGAEGGLISWAGYLDYFAAQGLCVEAINALQKDDRS